MRAGEIAATALLESRRIWPIRARLSFPSLGRGSCNAQFSQLRSDILGTHQRLAHKNRLHARTTKSLDISARTNAALAHEDTVGRHSRGQVQRVLQSGLERVKVAVVDADQAGAGLHDAVQVRGLVALD